MPARTCLFLIFILPCCTIFKNNPTKGNPPGTVKVNDTLYVDRTEIGNVHWREYWYYVDRSDSANAYKVLPDTSVWRDSLIYSEPLAEYYFRHPSFNIYPVVGISYDQAVEFCKWRTYVANQGRYFDENKIKNFREHLTDTFPIKFYYRLPTKKEWEMIAAGNLPIAEFPYGYQDVYRKWRGKKRKIFNCIFPDDKYTLWTIDSAAIYTADIRSFFPNSFRTYNMIGNLAEMVVEKGIAKGGSFIHQLDSCKIMLDQHYTNPQVWIGFRCVAVKVK